MDTNKKITIDIEPTWTELCHMVSNRKLDAKMLLQACEVADIVRQAQKQGKQIVLFVLNSEEAIVIDDIQEALEEITKRK